MTAPQTAYQGIWPALLTPLTADLSIDIPAFARHARHLLDEGCAGVTPFGTTGEGPSFSVAERMAAVKAPSQHALLPSPLKPEQLTRAPRPWPRPAAWHW